VSVFVDTSALLSVIDGDEINHVPAKMEWDELTQRYEDIVCTNYVLVETVVIAQNRLGLHAVRALEERVIPVLHVIWIGVDDHRLAMKALLLANRRRLSLVDCASFDVMRRLGIRTVFAFDQHFAEQGFECVPHAA
jgi:predicted nucleic acid-binding protein